MPWFVICGGKNRFGLVRKQPDRATRASAVSLNSIKCCMYTNIHLSIIKHTLSALKTALFHTHCKLLFACTIANFYSLAQLQTFICLHNCKDAYTCLHPKYKHICTFHYPLRHMHSRKHICCTHAPHARTRTHSAHARTHSRTHAHAPPLPIAYTPHSYPGNTLKARNEISDHRPVWGSFYAELDNDKDVYGDLKNLKI